MDTLSKGSEAYRLAETGGLAEADRLRRQARLAVQQELPLLLESLPQGGRLVDLGCGSGLLCAAVAEARPDAQVLGVDPDPLAIAEAQRLFGGPRLAFVRRGAEDGPEHALQQGDVLVMRLVLMHLPRAIESLRGLKAWLRPGGRLHLIEGDDRALRLDPAPEGLPRLLDLMERAQQARGGSRRLGQDLGGLLDAAGWRVLGLKREAPPEAVAAKAVPAVFAPVAGFYLEWARGAGLIGEADFAELGGVLGEACNGALSSAFVPLFHAWADAPEGPLAPRP